MVVDGRVGAAPRRTGERDGLGALAVAADEQLGAGADEGELRRADAPAVAGGEDLAQGAEDGPRVVGRRRVRAHLAGQHDLLELTGADPLDRALDGVLVVRGRRGARHAGALDRVRIQEGHRHRVQLPEPRERPLHDVPGVVVGEDPRTERHPRRAVLARERDLRQHERRRLERRPLGRAPAVVGEGKATDEYRPRGRRPARIVRRVVAHDTPAELPRPGRRLREAARSGRLDDGGLAERGEREAAPLGLLETREAIVRPPGAQHRRAQVELGGNLHGRAPRSAARPRAARPRWPT